jgi:hypothetical protein
MKVLDVHFYMKGGHVVTATGVKEVKMTRDTTTGAYIGYEVKWCWPESSPELFTLSIPDIVAVVATDVTK